MPGPPLQAWIASTPGLFPDPGVNLGQLVHNAGILFFHIELVFLLQRFQPFKNRRSCSGISSGPLNSTRNTNSKMCSLNSLLFINPVSHCKREPPQNRHAVFAAPLLLQSAHGQTYFAFSIFTLAMRIFTIATSRPVIFSMALFTLSCTFSDTFIIL